MNKVVTYCSASCKHNSGQGYYNSCQHPSNKDQISYAGIDRYYVEGCALKESSSQCKEVM